MRYAKQLLSLALAIFAGPLQAGTEKQWVPSNAPKPPADNRQSVTTTNSSCRSAALGTQRSQATPVPSRSPGSWWIAAPYIYQGARALELIQYGPFGLGESGECMLGQDGFAQFMRNTAVPDAMATLSGWDGSMIELGGCAPSQWAAVAAPADMAWAYLSCGQTSDATSRAAIALCVAKTGCSCSVIRTSEARREKPPYPPC